MPSELEIKILESLRDVPDFPKKGIVFKDITPLLKNPELLNLTIKALAAEVLKTEANIIIGLEARGFIFGSLLAQELKLPFVPIRKLGKLPWKTKKIEYALEYGTASIELHEDALSKGDKVIIIDDLLATGGTCEAACKLIESFEAKVVLCAFVIELAFLKGRSLLEKHSKVISLSKVK